MQRYVVLRLLQGVIVLLLVSVGVFALARISGDPTYGLLGADASPEQYGELRRYLGLDRPLPEQYLTWAGNVVRLDFGTSLQMGLPVRELIAQRLPNTMSLAAVAFAIALALGLPLGMLAALRKDTWVDWAAKVAAFVGMSAPSFWVATILVLVFSVELRWLPTSGNSTAWHYILPGVTLGFGVTAAGIMRLMRSSLLDILDADYIKLARAVGIPERRVIAVHAFRNATIPVLTYIGVYFSLFLSGSVVVETIFRWPGVGLLAYEAVRWHDFPLLQGVLLMVCAFTIIVNLVIDIAYAYVDPRIRY